MDCNVQLGWTREEVLRNPRAPQLGIFAICMRSSAIGNWLWQLTIGVRVVLLELYAEPESATSGPWLIADCCQKRRRTMFPQSSLLRICCSGTANSLMKHKIGRASCRERV